MCSRLELRAALLLLLAARLAGAYDAALLPPVADEAAAAAVTRALASYGIKTETLTGAQLVAKDRLTPAHYPLALLVGGDRYADTVAEDGDAVSVLRKYVDDGGWLVVVANAAVLTRPLRWFNGAWEPTAAGLRRTNSQTSLGLVDAGALLDTQPPPGSLFVVNPKAGLGERLTERLPLPADAGPYRPIPGNQLPTLEFTPWLTLVDPQGGTYGAAIAEMRNLDNKGGGSTVYVWSPLLLGARGADLLAAVLATRHQRGASAADRERARALGLRADGLRLRLEQAAKMLPAGLRGTALDALRAELVQTESRLGTLKEAAQLGQQDYVAAALDKLEPATANLNQRAGRAIDEATTAAETVASPAAWRVTPATTAVGTRPAPPEAAQGGSCEPSAPALYVGQVLLVPSAEPRNELAPVSGFVAPTPAEAPGSTGARSPAGTEPTPGANPLPGAPGGLRPLPPFPQTANPVLEFDLKDTGKVCLELFPDAAPKTCSGFLYLARSGFYNGTCFHRRVEGFVVQGGDPLSKTLRLDDPLVGTGGPGWTVPGEFSTTLKHLRGTVGLARAARDPDSGGSQFYICLAPQPSLDQSYTIFGRVIKGLELVERLPVGTRVQGVRVLQGADPHNPAGAKPLELFNAR